MPTKQKPKEIKLETVTAKLKDMGDSAKAREYISNEYPYLTQDSVTGLLMAILIEIVKGRIKE